MTKGAGLLDYVATQGRDTDSQATTRRWARCWVRGARRLALGLGVQASAQGADRRARHEHWVRSEGCWACARGAGALPRRTWARRLGCRLCTWCTQPVFDPVLTQYCFRVNFWARFMNIVHEHCSSQKISNFFKFN